MSNSSSSPVVLRIQQSAVVFVVLILALGALVLAANNIDPNASVRGDVRYSLWKSPDGLFSMDLPTGWTVKPLNGPAQYQIAPGDGSASGLMNLVTISGLGLKITDADKNPKNVFDQIIARQAPTGPIDSQPVLVNGLQGVAGVLEVPQTDQTTGATTTQESQLWVVPLDGSDLLLTSITSSGTTSSTIKPLWQHMMDTLRFDRIAALRVLGVGIPTATPTSAPTQAVTEGATSAATSPVTSAATSVATAVGTAAP